MGTKESESMVTGRAEEEEQTYQATDAAMAPPMRQPFEAKPSLDKRVILVAFVNMLLRGPQAHFITNEPSDAVVCNLEPRPEAINIARKRPIRNASLVAYAVAPKAGDGVEDV